MPDSANDFQAIWLNILPYESCFVRKTLDWNSGNRKFPEVSGPSLKLGFLLGLPWQSRLHAATARGTVWVSPLVRELRSHSLGNVYVLGGGGQNWAFSALKWADSSNQSKLQRLKTCGLISM